MADRSPTDAPCLSLLSAQGFVIRSRPEPLEVAVRANGQCHRGRIVAVGETDVAVRHLNAQIITLQCTASVSLLPATVDQVTRELSAFRDAWERTHETRPSYRPSLTASTALHVLLADYYDAVLAHRGRPTRAFRGASSPTGWHTPSRASNASPGSRFSARRRQVGTQRAPSMVSCDHGRMRRRVVAGQDATIR